MYGSTQRKWWWCRTRPWVTTMLLLFANLSWKGKSQPFCITSPGGGTSKAGRSPGFYDETFSEVIADRVWIIKLPLPFVLEAFQPKRILTKNKVGIQKAKTAKYLRISVNTPYMGIANLVILFFPWGVNIFVWNGWQTGNDFSFCNITIMCQNHCLPWIAIANCGQCLFYAVLVLVCL